MKIQNIYAREILDSRANPTVEVVLVLEGGSYVRASCPSGASVGTYEAKEIRDNDPNRMAGLGVLKAVNNIQNIIAPKLQGLECARQNVIDKLLIELDGTKDKSNLGANAILPVSIAVAKAGAVSLHMQPYEYLRHYTSHIGQPYRIPTPLFNIINGGKHAADNLDFQEFIVIPAISTNFSDGLNIGVSTYHALKKILNEKGQSTLIGDEGGFSPKLATNRDALVLITEAIAAAHLRLNYDIFLGLDAASNNFYRDGLYTIRDKGTGLNTKDFITVYEGLNAEYNFLYLEDPLSEDDIDGWEALNSVISKNTIITGDDLTTTNYERLQKAISKNAISGIIIKPNQIGTITESIAVADAAKAAGIKVIVSHRSGETNDDFIADFSVAMSADYAKFGSPARGERVSKYNRLSEINMHIKPV